MTLKQTLVNMALAGAAAFGIGMCARGEPEPCQVEFDNYKCERYALGQDRLPDFYKDGYRSEIRVYEDGNLIIKYIPATEESCKLDPPCGNHFDSVLTASHEIDMALKLAQKCENLLEQKYNKDF